MKILTSLLVCLLFAGSLPVRAQDIPPYMIGHKGSPEAPENTLPAYEESVRSGFAYVECDLSSTKDGVLVLLHDDTLNRTSSGHGRVQDYTFAQLQQLDFGSWKGPAWSGTKIPSFEEFLSFCKGAGLAPYVELKEQAGLWEILGALELVKKAGMEARVSWISFDAAILQTLASADSSLRLGYVIKKLDEEKLGECRRLQKAAPFLFADLDVDELEEADIRALEKAKIPVEIWTLDDRLALFGLDDAITGITSNTITPAQLKATLPHRFAGPWLKEQLRLRKPPL